MNNFSKIKYRLRVYNGLNINRKIKYRPKKVTPGKQNLELTKKNRKTEPKFAKKQKRTIIWKTPTTYFTKTLIQHYYFQSR